VACLAVLISLPLQAKRVALVMGNDNYTSVSKLQKAGNDATAMARELKNAGFTVQLHKDLNYRGMVRAVEAFTNNITGGDEVVVFFAGHGVQIRNGSYLLPTDIEANSESEVEKTAYELLALTDKISEAKPAFSLVMVDACRDNPLKSKGRSIGNARGLSAIEPPKGQMVVYSASRGQQALDRLSDKDPNPNGVFTREFITQMQKPGVRIEDIMRSVQDSVETLARSVSHEQRPAVYNEARGNFYFFGPTTVQVAPAQQKPDTNAIELALWESVKNATTAIEIQAYLNRFPNGFFAEVARVRIDAIGRASAERVAAENTLRLAGEARAKEQERILAEQRVKDQERVSALNVLKLADERAKEEAKRKLALEIAAQDLAKQRDAEQAKLLAHEKAFKDEIKRLADEKTIKDAADRIALTTTAIERAQRMAGQAEAEAERLANKPPVNLSSTETSVAQIDQSEFDRVIEEARSESFQSRLETEKSVQEFINKRTPGSNFKDCEICPEMVVIPAGRFEMGSSSSWFSSDKPPENEQPARNVTIKSFAMGKFEVTQKQWRELMGTSPSKFKGDDLPVEQVTWEEVHIYLEKLSSKTGSVYRLPSEAEWEYAALAGQQFQYPSGESPAGISRLAWFNVTTNKTEPIGTRASNKFGLFDMFGNVEEWTADCFNPNYLKAPSVGVPWLDGLCTFRVVRGGSWSHSVAYLRTKSRHQVHMKSKVDNLGFRVVNDFLN
jgi:formylglycine-generating enzyme required for sulfatase activity